MKKARNRKIDIAWLQLDVECEELKFIETDQNSVCWGLQGRIIIGISVKEYKLSELRWVSSGDLIDSIGTVTCNWLYVWNLLRK